MVTGTCDAWPSLANYLTWAGREPNTKAFPFRIKYILPPRQKQVYTFYNPYHKMLNNMVTFTLFKPCKRHLSFLNMIGGGGSIRSATTHVISDCKLDWSFCGACRCRCGELIWTCLVWAELSTPDSFSAPRHQLKFATGEQKWITQTILLTWSRVSRLPNSLMPSREVHNSQFLRLWCDTVGERTPAFHTLSGRSYHYATWGWY